jgi:YVTN family beta-propeller protein
MHPLGHAGSATGDPSGLAVAADGTVLVSLGGVNEVALGREQDFTLLRLPVGRRPTAIVVRQDSRRAFVANTFGDSVSVIDLAAREVTQEIALGGVPPLSMAERGELLFYDAGLSHDRWMSCHSCHTDGHANGSLSDNLSDRSFGAPKRILSLLGVGQTPPFAWNAGAPTLAHQIRKSIELTMQSDVEARAEDVAALAAFLETLQPPPSLDRARGTLDPAAVARGQAVFARRACGDCHTPPTYTSDGLRDVGLQDALGNGTFNPPSLRGVSQRGPYFHDNRAPTLDDVFRRFAHPFGEAYGEQELQDLLALLRSL